MVLHFTTLPRLRYGQMRLFSEGAVVTRWRERGHINVHTFRDLVFSHLHNGADVAVSETAVSGGNIGGSGGCDESGLWRRGRKHVEPKRGGHGSTENFDVVRISDPTGVSVKMGSVIARFIQGTDRDEVHASVGGMENAVEAENMSVGEGQHNVSNADSMNSVATNPLDRVLS